LPILPIYVPSCPFVETFPSCPPIPFPHPVYPTHLCSFLSSYPSMSLYDLTSHPKSRIVHRIFQAGVCFNDDGNCHQATG
jgi:hypothetical protein